MNAIVEHVDALDQQQREAHERIRNDLRQLEVRVESNYSYFRERAEANASRVERLAGLVESQTNAPVNLDRLLFTPKLVITIVVSLLSIYGFFLAATGGLKTDIAEIKSTMVVRQVEDKARAETQDVRDKALQNDINELRKQVQLMNLQQDAKKGPR